MVRRNEVGERVNVTERREYEQGELGTLKMDRPRNTERKVGRLCEQYKPGDLGAFLPQPSLEETAYGHKDITPTHRQAER